LDIIRKIWAHIGKLFAPPGVLSWLRACISRLQQWFPTCGTRATSGTRRSSRWYASTFCLLLDRREFLVQVGLILRFF